MFYAIQYKKALELLRTNDVETRPQYDSPGSITSVHVINGNVNGPDTLMVLNHPLLPEAVMKYVVAETCRIIGTTPYEQLDRMIPYVHINKDVPTVVVLRDEFIVYTSYNTSFTDGDDIIREELKGALRCLSLTWEGLLEGVTTDVQTIQVDPYDIERVKSGKYNIVGSTAVFFMGDLNALHHVFKQTHSLKSVKQMEHELKGYIQLDMWETGNYDFAAVVKHIGSTFTVALVKG